MLPNVGMGRPLWVEAIFLTGEKLSAYEKDGAELWLPRMENMFWRDGSTDKSFNSSSVIVLLFHSCLLILHGKCWKINLMNVVSCYITGNLSWELDISCRARNYFYVPDTSTLLKLHSDLGKHQIFMLTSGLGMFAILQCRQESYRIEKIKMFWLSIW